MPRKHERVRVEPGLYQAGTFYYACATPPGGRSAKWKALGEVGVMRARRLRDEFRADVRGGRLQSRTERVPLATVAAVWLEEQERLVAIGELSKKTYEIYEGALRLHVLPTLGSRPVQSITPDDLVAWHRACRSSGAAQWTIRSWWVALRGVLAHAARHGLIAASPADKLTRRERPKRGESRKRYLSRDDMQALVGGTPGRYRTAVATAMFSGLRLGELLGLTWGDVDFDREQLRVRAQMTRGGHRCRLKTLAASREVILVPALARMLREHRVSSPWSRDQDLVFATVKGTTIGDRNLALRGLERGCDAAELADVTFHTLRHTFASLLVAQGHDVVFVSRQLGHADAATTLSVYSHLFDAARHARQARDRLDAEYGGILRDHG